MSRSFSEDEWELLDLPRQLAYEASRFDDLRLPLFSTVTVDQEARAHHAALLARQKELQHRVRLFQVMDRWTMRHDRIKKNPARQHEPSPLTPMGMDESIVNGKIVDEG